jgi:hypothetical protein
MGGPLRKTTMPTAAEALPGRPQPMSVSERRFVNGHRTTPPFPDGYCGLGGNGVSCPTGRGAARAAG